MNWDALGAMAEALGAAGVIITLLYLAYQIRDNSRQMRYQAFVALTERRRQLNAELRQKPDLLQLILKGNHDWSRLDQDEQCAYVLWNVDEAQLVETAFVLWKENAITETLYLEQEKYYLDLLRMPGRRHWWENHVHNLDQRFRERIDELLKGIGGEDGEAFLSKYPMYRRD